MLAVLGLLLSALVVCTASGPANDPISRQFTWFSYLKGDALRAQCLAGSAPRYRLVYNADWQRQVRTYDLMPEPGSGATVVETRVFGAGLISGSISLSNPSASLGGERSSARISMAQLADLDRALTASGFERAAPKGRRIWSDTFYWGAIACRNGQIQFNVFDEDMLGFDGLPFAAAIRQFDRTGVAFPRPSEGYRQRSLVGGQGVDEPARFQIQVGENGLYSAI
jgi:hypothetical protein